MGAECQPQRRASRQYRRNREPVGYASECLGPSGFRLHGGIVARTFRLLAQVNQSRAGRQRDDSGDHGACRKHAGAGPSRPSDCVAVEPGPSVLRLWCAMRAQLQRARRVRTFFDAGGGRIRRLGCASETECDAISSSSSERDLAGLSRTRGKSNLNRVSSRRKQQRFWEWDGPRENTIHVNLGARSIGFYTEGRYLRFEASSLIQDLITL